MKSDERQKLKVAQAQEERSQRSVQDENDKTTFAGPTHMKGLRGEC